MPWGTGQLLQVGFGEELRKLKRCFWSKMSFYRFNKDRQPWLVQAGLLVTVFWGERCATEGAAVSGRCLAGALLGHGT